MIDSSFQSLTRNPIGGAPSFFEDCKPHTAFSRWGDGEWACMFFMGLNNCDGCQYFYDLAERLREVIANSESDGKDYLFGMQEKAWNLYKFEITAFLSDGKRNKTWCDADVLHKKSESGNFLSWLNEIKQRDIPVGFVANSQMVSNAILPVARAYTIADRDAWLYYDKKKMIDHFDGFEGLIFFCAGMAANVMIDDLYFSKVGEKCCLIDAGSVFDPYILGKPTRNYHKNILAREAGK